MENNQHPSVVVKSITFDENQKIDFNSDDIVLLVGANNVGKSRTLKDLKEDLIGRDEKKVLVADIAYKTNGLVAEQLKEYFGRNVAKDEWGNYIVYVDENSCQSFGINDFASCTDNIKSFYKVLFSFLTTENRLNVTRPISFNFGVNKSCLNIIKKLEEQLESINLLNEVLTIAFGKSVDVFEYYENDNIVKEYRIGKSEDISRAINSNRRDSQDKLSKEERLQGQGDGIRSAIAVLASLIVNEHSLFLIYEPESFLHPLQAKLIGRNIVELSKISSALLQHTI